MSVVDKIKAYKEAVAPVSNSELRYPLSTDDAVALASELGLKVEGVDVLSSKPAAEMSREQLIGYYQELAGAASKFWREFSGTSVEGVEVVRSAK